MANTSKVRVVLTGGGSGGHIYPLISVIKSLRQFAGANGFEVDLTYLGPADEYSAKLKELGIVVVPIARAKLRRYASGTIQNLLDIPNFFVSLLQAWWKLFWLMPDVIFSKGGTGALPVVFWGWFYRIPVMIHESDSRPGLTNMLSSLFAKTIALSFEGAGQYMFNKQNLVMTGNPIRSDLLEERLAPEVAKERLGFSDKEPLILVTGGSQGSQKINEFVLLNLPALLKEGQILHQAGTANYQDAQKLTRAELIDQSDANADIALRRYKIVPYLDQDMKLALEAADLVIGRAGSGTISELAAFGKPSILIPHTASNDHQRSNAYEFAKGGATTVIEEANFLPGIFISQVHLLLTNEQARTAMSEAARKFAKTDAADLITKELLKLVK